MIGFIGDKIASDPFLFKYLLLISAQSCGAVENIDCISAEG